MLLIALLTLILAQVSGNQTIEIFGCNLLACGLIVKSFSSNNPLSTVNLNPRILRIIGSHYLDIVQDVPEAINPFNYPPLSDKDITFPQLGYDQKLYWLRLVENKRPDLVLNLASSGARLSAVDNCKVPSYNRQSGLLRSISPTNDFLESFPLGYFLRV